MSSHNLNDVSHGKNSQISIVQVAQTLHCFNLHKYSSIYMRFMFTQINSPYVMHYMFSSLYTVKKYYLSIHHGNMFHFTGITTLHNLFRKKNLV